MKPVKKVYDNRIEWCLNGKRHRIDGPAVENGDGNREWWQNGKLHRTDGPAVEYNNGDKFWYQNGQRHREDGPALELSNGDEYWFLYDIEYFEQDYWIQLAKLYPNQIHRKPNILTALL